MCVFNACMIVYNVLFVDLGYPLSNGHAWEPVENLANTLVVVLQFYH